MAKLSESVDYEKLLKRGRPIYVLNKNKPKAVISLTLTNNAGERRYGAIPSTWVPVDLTRLFPRTYLRDCFDLIQYFNKGILEIVSQVEAEKMLSRSDAMDELTRISKSAYSGRNVDAAMKALREAAKDVKRLSRTSDIDLSITDSGNVNDRVQDVCVRIDMNTLSPSEGLTELKALGNDVTESDLQYIIDTSNSNKIKSWAKRKLAEVANDTPHKKNKKSNSRVEDEEDDEDSD